MNVFIELGEWWESRRVLRKPDLVELEKKIESLKAVPHSAKELAIATTRLDRLELFVGLKRDPKPAEVPGAARIG